MAVPALVSSLECKSRAGNAPSPGEVLSFDAPRVERENAHYDSGRLQVEASVEALLSFTSRTVEVKVAFCEQRSEEVWLVGRLAKAARVQVRASLRARCGKSGGSVR
jgi:hypothetical protein